MDENELRLRALARMRQAQAEQGGGQPATPQPAAPKADTSFWGALTHGVDQAGRSIGGGLESVGELTGWDALQTVGRAQRESNEADIARRNYQRPQDADGVWTNLKEFDLPGAGKSLGYAAAESGPSIATGAVASGAALMSSPVAIGTALGATGLGIVQALGETRQEKTEQGLDPTANLQDLGTAFASGLIELVPAGRGSGFVLSFTKEGLQEAGQEGLIIGNTAIQGGKYVPEDVANRLAEAGITGGAISKGIDVAVNAPAQIAQGIRYDNREFTPDEVAAAQRIERHADNDSRVLGNVSDKGAGTARGATNAALREARADAEGLMSNLRSLAKARQNDEALDALRSVGKIKSHQDSTTSEYALERVEKAFPDQADATRLRSILKEIDAIQEFTRGSDGDMGGLSRFTKKVDITDRRNQTSFGAYALMATGSYAALGAGPLANRVARQFDRLTNRRSRVKRFVDSARRSGTEAPTFDGERSTDTLRKLKQQQAAQKAADQFAMDRAKELSKLGGPVTPRRPADLRREAELRAKIPEATPEQQARQAEAQRLAAQKEATNRMKSEAAFLNAQKALNKAQRSDEWSRRMDEAINDAMFNTGVIPEGRAYDTYRMMQHFTTANPATALTAIQGLEQEGLVPPGTADRFQRDPDWFRSNKKDAFRIQELVRQVVAPDHVAGPYTVEKPTPQVSPEEALRRLDEAVMKPTSSRRKQKALEGDRRYKRTLAEIEKAEASLDGTQYGGLLELTEMLNDPKVTRSDRHAMVADYLPAIFPDNPALQQLWHKKFQPLAAIGNDYPIYREESEADPVEAQKEQAFEEKVKKAKKKPKKQKKPKEDLVEVALEKLEQPPAEEPALDQSKAPATKVQDVQEPQRPSVEQPKRTNARKGMAERVSDRIDDINYQVILSEAEGDNLNQYIAKLPKHAGARVEGLMYQFASDRLTMNQLVDGYAAAYDIPPVDAARIVNEVLIKMERGGIIKRFSPSGSNRLVHDGRMATDADGQLLDVVQITVNDGPLKDRLEVAKAVRTVEKIVPQGGPRVEFTPNDLHDGAFNALKDIPDGRVNGTYAPLLNFVNALRNSRLSVSDRMLTQLEDALEGTGDKRQGTINEVLVPPTKDGKPDQSPLRTLSQMLWQLGRKGERADTTLRQEWMAGANGRVYSKNGLAHSQAGDMMKGILRAPEKKALGGPDGLNMLMHSIGNLLGYDNQAPAYRRSAIFDHDLVDKLLKFSEAPFGRNTMKTSRGNSTGIQEMVNDGEGFMQVLNAAHEVSSMVDWAKARHKDKANLAPADLLAHPEVEADLAENYSTDFIVQLDAKNNAYQNMGIMMGDPTVLQETGLLPSPGVEDPDSGAVADIYVKPAVAVAERIPELTTLDLPTQKLRKLFKGPIGTYLYAAAFDSRKKALKDKLQDLAGPDVEIVGIGDEPALITIDPALVANMKSDEGHTFQETHYNADGDVKSQDMVRRRVVKDGDKFRVQSAKGAGEWKNGPKQATAEDAIKSAYENDLYARINRELVREMNTRFPAVRQFLNFSETVSKIVKERGGKEISVPSRDGIDLRYSFKDVPGFVGPEVQLDNGRVVRLGVRSGDTKLAGRGLAAFMAHQMDAFVLREVYRRMGNPETFNPIHDSYGFHPSDATRGQDTWVGVMQELGSEDYNIFLNVLEANGITLQDFVNSGGDPETIMGRRGVSQVPTQQIPTALS